MVLHNQSVLDEDTPISQNAYRRNTIYIHNVTVYADYGVCLDLNEVSSKFGNSLYVPSEFNCVRIDVRLNKQFKHAEFPLDKAEAQNPISPQSLSYPPLIDSSLEFQNSLTALTKFRDKKFNNNIYNNRNNNTDEDTSSKTSIKVSVFGNGKVVTTGARSIVAAACGLEKVARALRRRVSKEAKICFMIVTNILSVYNVGYSLRLNIFAKLCPGATYEPDRFPGAQIKIPTKRPLYLFTATSIFGRKLTPHDTTKASNDDENKPSSKSPTSDSNIRLPPTQSSKPLNPGQPTSNHKHHHLHTKGRRGARGWTPSGGKISIKNIAYFNKLKNSPTSDSTPSMVVNSPTTDEPLDVPKGKSAWISSDIYDNLNEIIGVVGDGHTKGRGINKEEVVTVNVFSTGKITLTGARSISSIKYALSLISPHLAKCK